MKKLRLYLSTILVLQLLVLTGLTITSQLNRKTFQPQELLAFDPSTVDKLVVADGSKQVVLQEGDGKWTLPDLDNLPADKDKLALAIANLAALKSGWPVTTTTNSHERFEVADNKFKRRIQLFHGDKQVAELYLGTSPGFRKTHGRVAGENDVYALALNTYDFPIAKADWLDKQLLSADDVTAIKGPDYLLEKSDKGWAMKKPDGATTDAELNQGKADELGKALSSLQVVSLAKEPPDFSSDQTINLDVTGAKSWHYQLLHKGDNYFAKRSDRDETFTISQYDYDRLAGVDSTSLTASTKQEQQTETHVG